MKVDPGSQKPGMQLLLLALLLMGVMQLTCAASVYAVTPRSSITGQDINCGQTGINKTAQPYCRIAGDVTNVADACDANPECKAFVMETSYSGYLKTGGKPNYTEGYDTFCRIGTAGCTGSYMMRRRTDINGQDINCNFIDFGGVARKYCVVFGDLVQQLAACSDNPECKAVIAQTSGYEGYLKSSGSPAIYREGYVTYTKGV